jgi:Co/Zn/Cd efflux system component
MRASWIFSKNDVIANVGVILAGALVAMTDSPIPDTVIGVVVALIVFRGGVHILKDAKNESVGSSCCSS